MCIPTKCLQQEIRPSWVFFAVNLQLIFLAKTLLKRKEIKLSCDNYLYYASSDIFRTEANIYDGPFLQNQYKYFLLLSNFAKTLHHRYLTRINRYSSFKITLKMILFYLKEQIWKSETSREKMSRGMRKFGNFNYDFKQSFEEIVLMIFCDIFNIMLLRFNI